MMMNINIHRTGWAFYPDLPTQFVNIACNFNETTLYFRLTFSDHQISLAINFCHVIDSFIINFFTYLIENFYASIS